MNASRFKNSSRISTAVAAAALAVSSMLPVAASAADPYIESDGTSGISTGYRMKGTSRLEVDFALTEQTEQVRIFGDDAGRETGLKTVLYVSGGATHFAVTTVSSTRYKAGTDTARHTAVIDLPNDKVQLFTGDTADLNTTTGVSGGFSGAEANMPLPLFGRWGNTNATAFANCAKARIYGVKIYESGVLVRDFVPRLKDGVACFKDIVNGGFIIGENVSAFSAGGDVQTFADDGYVSTAANASGGKLYFDTGYKTTEKSAVAIDCALVENKNYGSSILRLFQEGSSSICDFNLNGNNGLRYQVNGTYKNDFTTAFKDTLYDDKDVRRTFYLNNSEKAAVVTSGHTNQLVTFTQSSTISHSASLKLASNWAGNGDYAPIKIYGCKIWEDGVLKRDFVPYVNNGTPGLRDNVTGAFVAASRGSGDTASSLAYGGAITGEQDAYVEATGSIGINTGVKLNGRSRFEVDFALTVTNANTKNWRVFGTDTQESNLKTWLGYDSALNTRMELANNNRYPVKADTARHLAGMNIANGSFLFATGATTNSMDSVTTDLSELEASLPLPIFGRYSNAEGTAFHNYTVPSARIYSIRIWESDSLTHEFLPYSRGEVVGFYDTVTGGIISNGSSFSFGGVGQDHGQLKAYVSPDHAATVKSGSTVALTAYAPGASSYRWLMDGEPVAGGADGTFPVEWAQGGTRTENGHQHTYQAIAVFDFYGCTRESEPSAAETVTSLFNPFTIIVK